MTGLFGDEKKEIFDYWNSKGIVKHARMNHDLELELARQLKHYRKEELMALIDFYAAILEPGVPEHQKKYFWTYKWNLWEFLKRGVRKFDGQELSSYLRRQNVESPKAIIFKRGK